MLSALRGMMDVQSDFLEGAKSPLSLASGGVGREALAYELFSA